MHITINGKNYNLTNGAIWLALALALWANFGEDAPSINIFDCEKPEEVAMAVV